MKNAWRSVRFILDCEEKIRERDCIWHTAVYDAFRMPWNNLEDVVCADCTPEMLLDSGAFHCLWYWEGEAGTDHFCEQILY